jgi:competence ComEA-like helix-hairpin-helix protein
MAKAERGALILLAAVVVLGVGTRSWRAYCSAPASTTVAAAGATHQIEAIDSVRNEQSSTEEGRSGRSARSGRGTAASGARGNSRGSARALKPPISKVEPAVPSVPTPTQRLDLDTATVEQLQLLPGVGGVLARRIIADRKANGAFGCLTALRSVPGIGAAVLRRIDSLVAFSGLPRPSARCSPGL